MPTRWRAIAGDPSLREVLRERGLAQAGRFSWDETARLTLEVYEGRPLPLDSPHPHGIGNRVSTDRLPRPAVLPCPHPATSPARPSALVKLALVVAVMRSGERGGAEALYDGLERGLRRVGHDVDRIEIALDESSFDRILESYVRCNDLDLRGYDGVISTKAPTYMVRHPHHVSYLVHTIRVFYDMFAPEYGDGTPEQHRQRRVIHAFDRHGMHPDRILRQFAIGHTPYRRLRAADPFWERVPFEALHLPPAIGGFREPGPGRYVFLPGRLHRWKRVHLLIEAFKRVRTDIPLKIAGTGEDEERLRRAAAGDPRIEFLGRVDDGTLLDLYAGALVVPFVPVDEDYGLVTIEAFLSKKPVITCSDSGEPTEIVRDGVSGFVVEPTAGAIAAKIEMLIEQPELAAVMGARGFEAVRHITWADVAARLSAPIEASLAAAPKVARPRAARARIPSACSSPTTSASSPPSAAAACACSGCSAR